MSENEKSEVLKEIGRQARAKAEAFDHPKIILEILEAAPPVTATVLRKYLTELVYHILEARGIAEKMVDQRNMVMGLVEAVIDAVVDTTGEGETSEADASAEQLFSDLMEKIKSSK